MIRKLAVAALIAATVGLVACSPADPASDSDRIRETTERLSDGRTVTCLAYKSGYAGGLSCDWEGAR